MSSLLKSMIIVSVCRQKSELFVEETRQKKSRTGQRLIEMRELPKTGHRLIEMRKLPKKSQSHQREKSVIPRKTE